MPGDGVLYGQVREVVEEVPERRGGDVVVGESAQQGVGGADLRAREGEEGAKFARRQGQQPGAADVGDEADAGLGHGDPRPLGDDPDGAVRGDSDAAAHHDPVHEGDVGLGIAGDTGVEVVLVAPERRRGAAVPVAGVVVDGADVAARAQPALPAPVMTTLSTAGSCSQPVSASSTRRTMAWLRALRALGRLRVRWAVRPTVCSRTGSSPPVIGLPPPRLPLSGLGRPRERA